MKKTAYLLSLLIGSVIMGSCSDFLDSKNIYSVASDNYYKNPEQINEALAGVYNAFYAPYQTSDEHLVAMLLEDVTFAGGGTDDTETRNIAEFVDPLENTHHDLWLQTYRGVARVNVIIESVANNDFSGSFNTSAEAEAFKSNTLGEAHFLRGFLMFRAARFFGGMPVITTAVGPYNVARASFTETFAQIASDFKIAAELLSEQKVSGMKLAEYGHANRWVAKGYLARTYLFYTGYQINIEKQATDVLPLAEGGELTKTLVVKHLEDVIDLSGYELTPDFRNLWPYAYVNQSAGQTVLPWAADNNLAWVGQDGPESKIGTGNREVMFALRYTNAADWGETQPTRNWVTLFCGIRKNSLVPFGEGWGLGTVHPTFFSSWNDDDTRKVGSVLVMGDESQGTQKYKPVQGNHETGLFNKKYTNLQHPNASGEIIGMFRNIYGNGENSYMLWHAQDFYYLRFADILLMHSELTGTATGLNKVHQRAYGEKHVDLAYSLEALKEERLREFAFEGIRWFDLVRWGDVASTNNYYNKEAEVTMENGSVVKYKVTYRPETKGLRPIPESEVRLSNGAYTQNPGW